MKQIRILYDKYMGCAESVIWRARKLSVKFNSCPVSLNDPFTIPCAHFGVSQRPIQHVPQGLKRREYEGDRSHPTSAEVKNS